MLGNEGRKLTWFIFICFLREEGLFSLETWRLEIDVVQALYVERVQFKTLEVEVNVPRLGHKLA